MAPDQKVLTHHRKSVQARSQEVSTYIRPDNFVSSRRKFCLPQTMAQQTFVEAAHRQELFCPLSIWESA